MQNTLGALALASAFLVLIHLIGILSVDKPESPTPESCARIGRGWVGYPHFSCTEAGDLPDP